MADYPVAPYSMFGTLKIRNNEYIGMYRGTVLDNNDPEGRGRCKVYVYGVYDDEFKKDNGSKLPWAEPSQPMFCGGHGKNGTFQCPDIDATVWVFFESGDVTRPIMFGQTTDAPSKSVDKTHGSGESQFNTDSMTVYWEGMYVEFYKPTHTVTVSAENIDCTASKNISGYAENNAYIEAGKDISVHAKHDVLIKADNNVSIESGKDINMTAAGSIKGTASSSISLTAPNSTIDGSSKMTGNVTIDGAAVVNSDASIGGISFLNHIHVAQGPTAPTSPPQ